MRTLRFLAVPALVAVLALAGCDSTGTGDRAPTLINASAFAIDTGLPAPAQSAAGANFLQAYARVGLVSTAIGVHLVVPQLATAAAVSAEPFVEAGTWVWSNTVPIDGSNVTFRLEGTPHGQTVDWRMRITAASLDGQAYDAFELYDAQTALNGRSGAWQLYYRIGGQRTQVLTADFAATSSTAGSITFAVPQTNPDPAARGAQVAYSADGGARLFDWREPISSHQHLVEWSASSHAGAITAWNYNDGARACWGADLQDTACTVAVH